MRAVALWWVASLALTGCAGVFGLHDESGGADDGVDQDVSCPADYTATATGSYKAYNLNSSFSAAQAACLVDGPKAGVTGHTHLVVYGIHDHGESTVAFNLMSAAANGSVAFWVGLSANGGTGTFQWVTDQVPRPNDGVYPWAAGEPIKVGSDGSEKDCGLVNFNSPDVVTFGCNYAGAFVCECDGHADAPQNY